MCIVIICRMENKESRPGLGTIDIQQAFDFFVLLDNYEG